MISQDISPFTEFWISSGDETSDDIPLPPSSDQLLVELYRILFAFSSHGLRMLRTATGIPVADKGVDSRVSLASITLAFSGCISIGIGILINIDEFTFVDVVPTSKNGSLRLIAEGTKESVIDVSTNSKT